MPARKRAATSRGAKEPPAKRGAHADLKGSTVPDGRRRSGRISRISGTTQKSAYFDEDSNDDEDDDAVDERATAGKKTNRGKGTVKTGAKGRRKSAPKEEEESEDEYEEEAVEVDEDDGGKDNEEEHSDDGAAEARVKVVTIAPLRSSGGVEYSDDTVHKNSMLFLKDLKANNKRSWLKANDGEYRRALKDWESFVVTLTAKLSEVDYTIPELPPRDVIFRIYRDTRFSKDATPYKPHFSAAWSRTGRKGPYACYYVHAEPGGRCFIGGGLWHPESGAVHKLRQSIDERPRRWRRVLNDPALKRTFLPAAAKSSSPEAALKAFADHNQENALKTRPKGFNPEHRDLNLLKLKHFTVTKKVEDSIIFGPRSQEKIINMFRDMSGFVAFLNGVVMPDPNLTDDESDEDGEDEENGPSSDGGD